MPFFNIAKRHLSLLSAYKVYYAKCHYDECRHGESHGGHFEK